MEIRNRSALSVASITALWPDGGARLTVVAKARFRFTPEGRVSWSPQGATLRWGDEELPVGAGGALTCEAEVCPFKPRADVVVIGSAQAPGGRAVPALDVTVRVGDLRHELRVWGDRVWEPGLVAGFEASPPAPFEALPLGYEYAFGGSDGTTGEVFSDNPLGKGFLSEKSRKDAAGVALPNIEDPGELLSAPGERPAPVGCTWIPRSWPLRTRHLGTYDDAWREKQCPAPPKDFCFEFYNGAPTRLQAAGYLQGGEAVGLGNLNPEGWVEFHLPGVRPQVILQRRLGAAVDMPMNLDTLVLYPDTGEFELLWRGVVPVTALDAFEYPEARLQLAGG